MNDEDEARLLWQQFEALLKERGWYLVVGDSTVHVCIPGDGGPLTNRYVEVVP